MTDIQTWYETTFMPWKEQAETLRQEKEAFELRVKTHAREVKHVVALLLEHKNKEAVHLWNELKLEPTLEDVSVDLRGDSLVMTVSAGKVINVPLKQMLMDLQRLLG